MNTAQEEVLLKKVAQLEKELAGKIHELKIEAALERVRSHTMVIQKSEELIIITKVIFNELSKLNFNMSQVGFGVDYKASNDLNLWVADNYQPFPIKLCIPYTDLPVFRHFISAKEKGLDFYAIILTFEEKNEWYNHVFKYVEASEDTKNAVYACPGMAGSQVLLKNIALYIYNYTGTPYSGTQNATLMRFGKVFGQAYQRFLDLQKAEQQTLQAERDLIEIKAARTKVETTLLELKSTQAQLIQSEKMASLGELTAGIAHEIQNPLNFVNNFSELNKELLEELKEEADKGNYEEVKLIAKDIEENEERINQHGKRADAIVKGMLQHSRQTKGVKELTDLNALCDEFFRLSYHGLRAKDKNFNADCTSDFDETIGTINIVAQDMGRVLLNLFNNAFYVVNEKTKKAGEDYKPIVSVQTKRVNDNVEIRVKDNGNGIPQAIIDKVFQPFFTTKPTGQGTGLGLSLSYDIITKEHNGTIKVESKEGEGTSFIIMIPV